jgi:hypothetical protein
MQAHWRGKARFVEVPFNGSAVNTNISINLTLQPSDGLIRKEQQPYQQPCFADARLGLGAHDRLLGSSGGRRPMAPLLSAVPDRVYSDDRSLPIIATDVEIDCPLGAA